MHASGPKPGQVTLGWDLTYVCNYRCPYCTVWDQPTKVKNTVAKWVEIWERMHRLYGRCYIYMSGGEPSTYPYFVELIEALTPMHTVDTCTNLSWKVERAVPEISPEVFRISASFHPTQVPFEIFLPKAVYVREYLPWRPEGGAVYFVADPKQMDRMEFYREEFAKYGIAMVPLPLVVDQGIGNTEEEKHRIEAISPNRGAPDHKLEYQLKTKGPNGRLCRAGHQYAMIRGDGMVDRCSRYTDRQVGNFLDPHFRLWRSPRPCYMDWCPYESQWIVEEPSSVLSR